jgi:aminoglycoside phosphotransferase (APT) family kinase protein
MTTGENTARPGQGAASPPGGTPPAEIEIDEDLVRYLLRSQHPDLAELPLELTATGWDNCTYRLGTDLAVRIPRRKLAGELLTREQDVLPLLALRLPVPVPVPVRVGRPDPGFPWLWSIVPWIAGRSSEHEPLAADQAGMFGSFLNALHRADPSGLPHSTYRGMALEQCVKVESRLASLAAVSPGVDWERVLGLWRSAVAAPLDTAETWIHADLHPKNVLVDGGRLVAVIDWGDTCLGDPATDLAAVWMHFPVEHHPQVWDAYGEISSPTLLRACGWAVFFGSMLLEHGSVDDPHFARIGRLTLQRLVPGST